MFQRWIQAARDADILDWIFYAAGILVLGLGVAYADVRTDNGARQAQNSARSASDP